MIRRFPVFFCKTRGTRNEPVGGAAGQETEDPTGDKPQGLKTKNRVANSNEQEKFYLAPSETSSTDEVLVQQGATAANPEERTTPFTPAHIPVPSCHRGKPDIASTSTEPKNPSIPTIVELGATNSSVNMSAYRRPPHEK